MTSESIHSLYILKLQRNQSCETWAQCAGTVPNTGGSFIKVMVNSYEELLKKISWVSGLLVCEIVHFNFTFFPFKGQRGSVESCVHDDRPNKNKQRMAQNHFTKSLR